MTDSAKVEVRQLDNFLESSDDAIITKTLDGIITSWNPAAQRIFGYTQEEAVGTPMLKLFPPDRQCEEPQILAKVGRGEKIKHFETVRVTKDGQRIEVSVTISLKTKTEDLDPSITRSRVQHPHIIDGAK